MIDYIRVSLKEINWILSFLDFLHSTHLSRKRKKNYVSQEQIDAFFKERPPFPSTPLGPRSYKKKRVIAHAGGTRGVHTEANELLLAVAPYVPHMAEEIVDAVSSSIPQLTETAGSNVPSISSDIGPSLNPTGCEADTPTPPATVSSTLLPLEMDLNKMKLNLIKSYVGKTLDEKEIVSLASETLELKSKILRSLTILAGEDNGPLLFNTAGADEIITNLERMEYKRSYLNKISRSLINKGKESSYYLEFLQKRLETIPNAWIQYLKIEAFPEEVIQKKLLSITSEFLMKDD